MQIIAPLSGILVPLEQVPDLVFSQRMVGDGVAIDPTENILRAPLKGKVQFIHSAKHALTISGEGVDVLIHIGLETVKMNGAGFNLKVQVGDEVQINDPLIEFDSDLIALKAKSLLTQVIVTSHKVKNLSTLSHVRSGQDVLFELKGLETSISIKGTTTASEKVNIINETGLHARPAAVLASAAKEFSSEITLKKGAETANAKSVVSILSLQVNHHDEITLVAEGSDAKESLTRLLPLIRSGLGESHGAQEVTSIPVAAKNKDSHDQFFATSSSPGFAAGVIYQFQNFNLKIDTVVAKNSSEELTRFEAALKKSQEELGELLHILRSEMDEEKASIFSAHLELLQDPELVENARKEIQKGLSAAQAWKNSYTNFASQLAKLKNDLIAGRANDVRDIGTRVLSHLLGQKQTALQLPDNAILLAQQLTPSQTVLLDKKKIRGFCTVEGGPNSHVAILARAMGIPSLTGISENALRITNGSKVILDAGLQASLKVNPSNAEFEAAMQKRLALEEKEKINRSRASQPAVTLDGHKVKVFANIGDNSDSVHILENGAEGVGLFRSEFLFLQRTTAPNEDEQLSAYQDVMNHIQSSPLVIRTLDIGGDKPLPYLPLPAEENPFLGVRGIRVSLEHQDLFRTQLRAILRIKPLDKVHIMFPMITSVEDFMQAKNIVLEECKKLNVKAPAIGVMVEVPSAALTADVFAPLVDFFSIGTNDLTQYVLAVDRGHHKLAAMADGLHPAVLKLIQLTVQAAHKHGKWVGVCGNMAGDVQAVPILLGLGVDELSVSVPAAPSIKSQVRGLSFSKCKDLASMALGMKSATEVRALVARSINEN